MCRANVRQTAGRFRISLIAAGTAAAALVLVTAVGSSAIQGTANHLNAQSSLSVVEISSVALAGEPEPVTVSAIDAIAALPGVESATGVTSMGSVLTLLSGGNDGAEQTAIEGLAGVFWVLPRFSWSQPEPTVVEDGWSDAVGLASGEVMLPDESLGVDLTPLLGARLQLEYTRATGPSEGAPEYRELTVVAFYDHQSSRRDGEDGIYLGKSDFDAVFAASLGAPGAQPPMSGTYQSGVIKAADISAAVALAAELSSKGFLVVDQADDPALPRVIQFLNAIGPVFGIVLGLFALGIGVSIVSTWAKLRRWDVGVLRALGWSPWDIVRNYGAEIGLAGLGVAAAGVLVGTGASLLLGVVMRGQTVLGIVFEGVVFPPVLWLGAVVLGLPFALLVGASTGLARLVRIAPDVALKRTD
jgi:putative ABC transport system permease protein